MGGLMQHWPVVSLNSTEKTNYQDKQFVQHDTEGLLCRSPLLQWRYATARYFGCNLRSQTRKMRRGLLAPLDKVILHKDTSSLAEDGRSNLRNIICVMFFFLLFDDGNLRFYKNDLVPWFVLCFLGCSLISRKCVWETVELLLLTTVFAGSVFSPLVGIMLFCTKSTNI